ncbi:branched-chain amino acid ABC transporter ATP-binding protein/permease [Streptomyces sp. NBC_01716]|uniref:branched-chain amino acid ABC transporter ATP-binding protein/permease n=1 Tax=Streptomyces sp. NBC_01716 TaxID=2975917 RepID=UPI002E309489|nr:branched-chain amino acid ABC transporter ATP-binding protein/permease [Streptomyces sp. NBC_01716]
MSIIGLDKAARPEVTGAPRKAGGPRRALTSAWAKHVAGPLVLVVIGLVASGNDYYVHLASAGVIAYILTAAFNIVYGYAGIFNLSIVITYGAGAFTSVYLEVQFGLPFWPALLISVAVTTALSVLVAVPTRGLNELFLAIQTLAFALALAEIMVNWEKFSGGTIGIYAVPLPTLFGYEFTGGLLPYYWLAAFFAWLTYELVLRIHHSAMRRKLTALREGPRVLAAVGVSPDSTRLVAFALSGALAGLAGVLFAHFQLVIDLDTFSFTRLVALLLAAILGGGGYFLGPVFGVVAILVMDELSLATSQAQDLVYGVGILVLVVIASGGIAGWLDSLMKWIVRRRGPDPAGTADALEPADPGGGGTGDGGGDATGTVTRYLADSVKAVHRDLRVEVRGVSVAFGGNTAVDDVSISFATGEVIGLIGPNGAGKTTLLNAITGDVRATGSVRLGDDEILGVPPQNLVRSGIGRTFQSPKVIPELTLLENVMLAGDGIGKVGWFRQSLLSPAARRQALAGRERAMTLLTGLALADRAQSLAGDQPYGVLRLVEIARNLMLDPAFLLLDEPGAGLTEFERAEIAATVRALGARDLGVVLVDHNLPLITSACDRVYVLDHGQVIAEGPPKEVFAQQEVISAYLGVPG